MSTELKILEDWGDVIAIDKPTGWLSIPGRGHKENIPVVSHVLGAQLRGENIRGKNPDLFIVHRLDQGTSGVMIFTKTAETHKKLGSLFENQKVAKTYWCIVKGKPHDQTINLPIFKIPSKKNKSVISPQGKPSETTIRVLASHVSNDGEFSLVEAKPLTGRSHQIRVHLAHLGTPLVGDLLYKGPSEVAQIKIDFPLLHCREIQFEWPEGEKKRAFSPTPLTFMYMLKKLGILNT